MYSRSLKKTLEIRSYFFEGLYGLMTNEERQYFWGKEILSLIGNEPQHTNPDSICIREERIILPKNPLGR
jgi:hypothetical protein